MAFVPRPVFDVIEDETARSRQYLDGESVFFNGDRYLLKIVPNQGAPTVLVKHKTIELHIRDGANRANKQAAMEAWYLQKRAERADTTKKKTASNTSHSANDYPPTMDTEDKRLLYDTLRAKPDAEALALRLLEEFQLNVSTDWREDTLKRRRAKNIIFGILNDSELTEEVYQIFLENKGV